MIRRSGWRARHAAPPATPTACDRFPALQSVPCSNWRSGGVARTHFVWGLAATGATTAGIPATPPRNGLQAVPSITKTTTAAASFAAPLLWLTLGASLGILASAVFPTAMSLGERPTSHQHHDTSTCLQPNWQPTCLPRCHRAGRLAAVPDCPTTGRRRRRRRRHASDNQTVCMPSHPRVCRFEDGVPAIL